MANANDDVEVGEIVTELVVTEPNGALSREEMRKIIESVLQHVRAEKECGQQREKDTGVRDRAAPGSRSRSWALTHRSGSLTQRRTNSATTAGATPITKMGRQPDWRRRRLTTAAMRKPAAHADWRMPAALARFCSGQTSATSAAPAAHSPPMPRAVRTR